VVGGFWDIAADVIYYGSFRCFATNNQDISRFHVRCLLIGIRLNTFSRVRNAAAKGEMEKFGFNAGAVYYDAMTPSRRRLEKSLGNGEESGPSMPLVDAAMIPIRRMSHGCDERA
jgi:hypothetical protein